MKIPEQILHASGERWLQRQKERDNNSKGIDRRNITEIETPERIQKRLDHLTNLNEQNYFVKKAKITSTTLINEIGLERVIGKDDMLGIEFLELALAVSRSVCKVNIYENPGRKLGSGTGFMVSPSLMMTNNHVLNSSNLAKYSNVQFNYQLNSNGNVLPSVYFTLKPDRFFLTDPDLDYTLVSVNQVSKNNEHISRFGWNKLMGEGKALLGDALNIIQHPNGELKQIVVQSNYLVDLLPVHAHYLTDTEPGSSGSIVCNNHWEVVALHHSGVPKIINGDIIDVDGKIWDGKHSQDVAWVANEGIRISRIINSIKNKSIPSEWEYIKKELFDANPPNPVELYNQSKTPGNANLVSYKSDENTISLNIPLKITLGIDKPANEIQYSLSSQQSATPSLNQQDQISLDLTEKTVIPYTDKDYTSRQGYLSDFLGIEVPLPEIKDLKQVSKMDNGAHILPYHHFSVVMNKTRRLAYYCASNVDGRKTRKEPEMGKNYSRKGLGGLGKNDVEAWQTDPRIPEFHQLPDKFYNKDRKSFDKGHIVRRDDVAWGSTYKEVRFANGDTFHTTNCSPQVADYNRSNLGGIWGKFENHVLKEAEDEKLIVFSGPIFKNDDRIFEGFDSRGEIEVKIPKAYWKIIVSKSNNKLKTHAFIFKQNLVNVDWEEEFAVTNSFVKYQKKLVDIENELDNIKFPQILHDTDQFKK